MKAIKWILIGVCMTGTLFAAVPALAVNGNTDTSVTVLEGTNNGIQEVPSSYTFSGTFIPGESAYTLTGTVSAGEKEYYVEDYTGKNKGWKLTATVSALSVDSVDSAEVTSLTITPTVGDPIILGDGTGSGNLVMEKTPVNFNNQGEYKLEVANVALETTATGSYKFGIEDVLTGSITYTLTDTITIS
ncbi:hypothetical protein I6N96_13300 [Enterococcus sp. BWM-S5]|uniref:WxL domain-containing protein n=1 Tax=Enterococcus larvae TaxID=2794352 RepID=A0ABS4CKX8_9ENTE|nr:hypothetical protein [Enterococcus larvae]MBP1047253.1 hypothetical protein [Enterococcus larvae]